MQIRVGQAGYTLTLHIYIYIYIYIDVYIGI